MNRETTTRIPKRPDPAPLEQFSGSLGEVLGAIDITIERAQAGDLASVTAALPMIREAVDTLRANTEAA
jgi:hypothetical protein